MWSNPKLLTLETLKAALQTGSTQWVLDLDGTLVDLAPSPDAIRVPRSLLNDLDLINHLTRPPVAILSGRSLADLVAHIPLPDLTLIGNHGAEWRQNGQSWVEPLPHEATTALDRVRPLLRDVTQRFPGSHLEDKQWTLSFHVRQTEPGLWDTVHQDLARLVHDEKALELRQANACWEIRSARGPTKGDAVARLLADAEPRTRAIVFGDDWTDEDAFQTAGPKALTVNVGPRRPTQAAFCINTPAKTRLLLHQVAEFLQQS